MSSNHTPPLVLVADDQLPTTMMLERVFEYEGYQVNSVHDGIAAYEAALELLPDLILLDVNMPKMNGFEVLKKLREAPPTASIPTILITAMGEWPDIVQGMTLGADDYVRKPFHPRELLARAESKIRARKLEDTLQRRTQDLEALLRVSEALNQNLEVDDLLELILCLALDLLPGDLAVIYQLNEHGEIITHQHMTSGYAHELTNLDHEFILSQGLSAEDGSVRWSPDFGTAVMPDFPHGLATTLQFTDNSSNVDLRGLMVVAGEKPYDDHHFQLFSGIGRHANMALRNAELYQIQANYALHLEDMVEERTNELQSTQRALIRSEKLASVGRLAASIAHEINNPLMPIKIILDDMLEDLKDGIEVEPTAIERTLQSVDRIRRVVDRLLEFTGRQAMSAQVTQQVDINRIIESVSELVRKSFEQQGKTINLSLNELPVTYGDKDGLEQVFMNLALNASEAMDKGGRVDIATYTEDDKVVITVSDTGSGIEEAMIETIFEPFITTKDDGNGLGLFVSYGIIQNHNGNLEVESQLDVGTTFTITLPISHEEVSETEIES